MIIVSSAPEDPATQTNQEISVNLRVSATLTLGFFGPAMFCWHSCFYEGHRSLLALVVTFFVTVAFIVSEIAMVLIRGEGGEQLTLIQHLKNRKRSEHVEEKQMAFPFYSLDVNVFGIDLERCSI